MTTLHTTAHVAALVGISVRNIQRHAGNSGIGTRVGRDILFTDADVRKLRKWIADGPERQRKAVTGNDFWRLRKSSRKDA